MSKGVAFARTEAGHASAPRAQACRGPVARGVRAPALIGHVRVLYFSAQPMRVLDFTRSAEADSGGSQRAGHRTRTGRDRHRARAREGDEAVRVATVLRGPGRAAGLGRGRWRRPRQRLSRPLPHVTEATSSKAWSSRISMTSTLGAWPSANSRWETVRRSWPNSSSAAKPIMAVHRLLDAVSTRPDIREQSYLTAKERNACKRGAVHIRSFNV
jgi:hypothetical protein